MEQTLKSKVVPLRDIPAASKAGAFGTRNTGYLLSREMDALMIGGASILFFMMAYLFVDSNASINSISWTAYYLGFVVNWPHFLVSYQLLYYDNRKKLLTNPWYAWAGIASPLILIGVLGGFIAAANTRYLGYMVNFMYLTVGWHYVKQIYGTTIVTSAIQKFYFTPAEKLIFRLNMYALWALSWISQNLGTAPNNFYSIPYSTLGIPAVWQTLAYVATFVTLAATLGMVARKYVYEGRTPPMNSMMSFVAIYVWFIPSLYHPFFFYMIPFFHSLQYLLFVVALRKNKAENEIGKFDGSAARKAYLVKFWGYMLCSGILGMAGFLWIPTFLDSHASMMARGLGPTLFIYAFNIFINVHHYFIDNVIWKGTNPELRDHLVRPSQVAA